MFQRINESNKIKNQANNGCFTTGVDLNKYYETYLKNN